LPAPDPDLCCAVRWQWHEWQAAARLQGHPLAALISASSMVALRCCACAGFAEDSAGGMVSSVPDLFCYAIHAESEFLILASDGVWDKVRLC